MKVDLVSAFKRLAHDVDLDPFTIRYCTKRLNSEGIQFLTVTLPKLSKAVLRSLELGYFERPTCFAWKRQSLRFFSKFLDKIFDRRTGKVLKEPCALSVYSLRQLCEYAYKLALGFSPEQLEEAERLFIESDEQLRRETTDEQFVEVLRKDFETYFPKLARATVSDILDANNPRPGPGTFSGKKEYGNEWFTRKHHSYECLASHKSISGYFKPYPKAPVPALNSYDPCYSEVLFVPKDSRGPRTIVREPYTSLSLQMAFNSFLSEGLTKASSGRVNFRDQQVNRKLAELSSRTKEWATLDLKDASDRVDKNIVITIFRNSPGLRYFVIKRTSAAKLPSGKMIQLRKLSGMGSGLTFPTMSLLIYLASVRAIVNSTAHTYAQAMKLVYVYGDDIIVKAEHVEHVMLYLARVKLRVNLDKSFRCSHFRESCGGDYLGGQDVTPIRLKLSGCELRSVATTLSIDGNQGLLQLERHCRELVRAGLLNLADYYYALIERSYGRLPFVSGNSPVIGRYVIHTTPTYSETSTGEYEHIRAILPVPVTIEFQQNPYIFIGQCLSRSTTSVLDYILGLVEGSRYGEVSVPRSIRYRRQKVSAFRLMG